VGSHILLLQINTLCCHQKELEHKGAQRYKGKCIVRTAGTSWDEATSSSAEEITSIALSIVELCL